MRVLFFMRNTVYVRNFESTLRLLAERGHQVHVAVEPHYEQDRLDRTDLMGRLSAEYTGITHGVPPSPFASPWLRIGYELRRGLDYLRYLEPEYGRAPKLRRRAEEKAPAFLTTPIGRRLTATALGRRSLARLIRLADRAVPGDPQVEAFVREQRPDLVVATPLVEPGSPQSAYLRAARVLGVRTALCVYSWDNLTNKGLIHDSLDAVTVWNEAMKHEAVTLHGVPAERVVVTGAVAYDHWFGWTPRATREAFCAHVGLNPARPFVLYLCSSKFIAPDELSFVRRWVAQVRGASGMLRDVGVLIRPHPQNTQQWEDADLGSLGNVAVWPRAGGNPVDVDARSGYFDSMYHSAAVVGVNTSAQIESAIVGRSVHTLLSPEFSETQEGTIHFRHLREVNGGLLQVASDISEHVAQLEAAIGDPRLCAQRCRRFVEAFVRPHGLDVPAAPRLVAALEAVAAQDLPQQHRGPRWAVVLRPAIFLMALALAPAGSAPPGRARGSRPSRG